jgi:ankyrin repeat protein
MSKKCLKGCLVVALLAMSGVGAAGQDIPLIEAVKDGDTAAVRALLDKGGDVNAPEVDGTTVLHWAVSRNNLDVADLLIRAGANVRATNRYGVAPLSLACLNGSEAMVAKLLQAGADPESTQPSGETALMTAARTGNTGVVQQLLARGADVNATEEWKGQTALMWAAAESHADVARLLIDEGAALVDVRTPTTRPRQRRQYAERELKVLREGEATNPSQWPRDGAGDPARSQGGFTPLLYGVMAGGVETVRALLDGGADVNEAAPDGVSALMLALTKRHEDLALFLLEQGADPNYDPRLLVLALGSPSLADGQDRVTPEEDATTPDFAGYSALHVAAATSQHRAMRAILEAGGDPNTRMDRPKRFIEAFEIGVFQSPGSGRITHVGSTPFMLAAKSADAEGMRILFEAGADPVATTDDGTTALALAAGYGKRAASDITFYVWNQDKAIEAVRYALELGIDINAVNGWGGTALHGATYHAANELIRFLVENGADMDKTDWENQTPLRLAKGHMICCTTYVEHPHIRDLLLELGADPEVGSQVTFGLLGYHAENKDGSAEPIESAK